MCINMKIYAKHDMAHKICSKIGNKQYNQKLQTPRERAIFLKISDFLAWADKLGQNFLGNFGYYWPNYQQPL